MINYNTLYKILQLLDFFLLGMTSDIELLQ